MSLRLAILISGRGSNMQAIHQAILNGTLSAEIKIILSNRKDAPGLDYARDQKIPYKVIEKLPNQNREQFDSVVLEELGGHEIDLVVLAGYMRILTPKFIENWRNKIVNIHPSLLPKFPGLHAQRQALEAGAKTSGCTVHFVDEGCDTGPIIAQKEVPVLPDDTEASLSQRILAAEHFLFSDCLEKISRGKVRVEAGQVILS